MSFCYLKNSLKCETLKLFSQYCASYTSMFCIVVNLQCDTQVSSILATTTNEQYHQKVCFVVETKNKSKNRLTAATTNIF
jgi:hypothetical protein